MRKYYQAALAVTAVVSVISLLFYRHEYNKLRYVLEVFNYFGKPEETTKSNCTSNNFTPARNIDFEQPRSSWQRLNDDLYVYSAYSIFNDRVNAIALGKFNSLNVGCTIYFENDISPHTGMFRYTTIYMNPKSSKTYKMSKYNGYQFTCTYKGNGKVVGLSFYDKSNTDFNNSTILPVKNQFEESKESGVAICIVPPNTKPMKRIDMFGHLNFHKAIGVDDFVIYDYGIPNEFNSLFKEISKNQNLHWRFTYSTVPWNFPFTNVDDNLIRSLIETECLYRTYNRAKYIITLSWYEYIVLKYHRSVVDLMKDFDRSRLTADRYTLETLTFCLQQPNDGQFKNDTLLIFRKTKFDKSITGKHPIFINKAHKTLKSTNFWTRTIGKDLITINKYQQCDSYATDKMYTHDSSILRFVEDVKTSPIYKYTSSLK